MREDRRSFLKKVGKAGAVAAAVGTTTVLVANSDDTYASDSNGVIVGKSNKKEIIYKKTQKWDEYYRSAL